LVTISQKTTNFAFLEEHEPLFYELASSAEKYFSSDPNTTLIKLRQLGEALAQQIAVLSGIEFDDQTTQLDLLYRINRDLKLEPTVREMFHILRVEGNKATHLFKTKHKDALDALKVARTLAVWFHRAFGKNTEYFKPGPFIQPTDPSAELAALQVQIAQLKNELTQANIKLEDSQQLNELVAKEKAEYEQLANVMDEESRVFKAQAENNDETLKQQQKEYEQRIQALQAQIKEQDEKTLQAQKSSLIAKSKTATQLLVLNEELTRILIDQHLIEAGWECDSQEMTYEKGARPEKGKNLAIAEWPTEHKGEKGRADYVLFAVTCSPLALPI